MEIDLTKPDIIVPEVTTHIREVPGSALRSRIREIISNFMARPRPVSPSDADLLNEYLLSSGTDFKKAVSRVAEMHDAIAAAPKGAQGADRLKRLLNEAIATRAELIAKAASSPDFLSFRSAAKARYNEQSLVFEQEAAVIQDLKPFLGMPSLPAVNAKVLTADVILTLLNGVGSVKPVEGQMVLMADEDIYARPQFFAQSSLTNGVSNALLAALPAVPVPYDLSQNLAVEALLHGAFERAGRVYFRYENGRPVSNTSWTELDRFLPFALRSLTNPSIPIIQPDPRSFSFEKVFGSDIWRTIVEDVKNLHANTCLVCGDDDRCEVFPRWLYREPVAGTYSPGVQVLDGFMVYCRNCSSALRPKLDSVVSKTDRGYVLSISTERSVWLKTINKWLGSSCVEYDNDAYLLAISSYRRRDQIGWIIDLSSYRSLSLMLEPGFDIDRSGWIKSRTNYPFKIVGAPIYDDTKTRHFFPAPSIFDVPWGSDIDAVAKIMDGVKLAVADKSGTGITNHKRRPDLSDEEERNLDAVVRNNVEAIDVDTSERTSDSGEIYDDFLPKDDIEDPSEGVDTKSADDDDDYDDDETSGPSDPHESFMSDIISGDDDPDSVPF